MIEPLLVYTQRMECIPDIKQKLNMFVRSILEGNFHEKRANGWDGDNKHLEVLKKWSRYNEWSNKDLKIRVHDANLMLKKYDIREIQENKEQRWYIEKVGGSDPKVLLNIGNAVSSCLKVDGYPIYNKCLLNDIMDGKIKVLILRDKRGRLLSRAKLKVLLKEKNEPYFFLEKTYHTPDQLQADVKDAILSIIGAAIFCANNFEIPLAISSFYFNESNIMRFNLPKINIEKEFDEKLFSLGGATPYEHVGETNILSLHLSSEYYIQTKNRPRIRIIDPTMEVNIDNITRIINLPSKAA